MATKQTPDEEKYNPSHNVGQEEFDKIIDRNISPGDEKTMEDRANTGAQQDKTNELLQQEQNAGENIGSSGQSREDVERQEESSDAYWQNNTSQEKESTPSRFQFNKKSKIGAGIIGGVFGLGLLYNLIFAPALGLVNLKEVLMDKFDNRIATLAEKRNARLMAKKMSGDFTTGCTIQIKCRFKGMTEREIKKFEKRNPGSKINTKRCMGVGSIKKCSIRSITYVNDAGNKRTIAAGQFKSELRKNASLRNNVRNYNKPTVAHWRDVQAKKFFDRFKIHRGKMKISDADSNSDKSLDEKRKMRTREVVREAASGEMFDSAVEANKQNSPDADGDGTSDSQAEDSAREQVSDNINEEADKIKSDLDDPSKAIDNPPNIDGEVLQKSGKIIAAGGIGAATGAVLGPVHVIDRACAAKRLIATVGYTAKLINMANLIRYSMLFMAAADQIKAGDADGKYANSVGDLGSVLSSRDPETGATMSDSFGYQYAAFGTLIRGKDGGGIDTAQIFKYSLGVGMTGTLLAITNQINKVPGAKKGCNFIGNPIVQITGAVIGIGAALLSGGGSAAASAALGAATGVALAVATEIATPILARSIAGAIVSGDETGQDAGNAITSGFASASSMNARGRGAYPLSKEQAVAYNEAADRVKEQIAYDSGLMRHFDTENPRSFASKLAQGITPKLSTLSFSSAPTSIASFSLGSLAALPSTSHAAEKGEEYEICNDPDYEKMNVAAGPFCDVQYGFDPATIDVDENSPYDAETVIAYMCGSSVDSEAPCTDEAYIDDNGAPRGDYESWIENCVDSDKPLASDGDDETPKECFDPSTTDDPVKYTMFRIYTFDSTFDDQYEDRDGNNEDAASETADSGTVSGDVKELAQELLNNSNVSFPLDAVSPNGSTKEVLKKLSEGKKAPIACPSGPGGTTSVNVNILKFLVELSQETKIGINAITDKCHSSGSNHYKGKAVDFECKAVPLDISKADKIASKYGGKRNNETCANSSHWHYDFLGGN